jgi:hypothetical protein
MPFTVAATPAFAGKLGELQAAKANNEAALANSNVDLVNLIGYS